MCYHWQPEGRTIVALPKRPLVSRMTVAEFLATPADGTGRLWQLVDGEPVAMAPASDMHGTIQAEVARLLGNYLRQARLPCRVVIAPGVSPRVRAKWNVRVPDLVVTCQPAFLARHLVEQPVLAVEILSPSNEAETWSSVWTYTTIPSMRDILVIRSVEVGAELLTRQADGTWPADFTKLGDRVDLGSIGAEFGLVEFYATTEFAEPGDPQGGFT